MPTHRSNSRSNQIPARFPAARAKTPRSGTAHRADAQPPIVSIAPEFHARSKRPSAPDTELAAFHHLGQFLTGEPTLLLNQLAATMLQLCDAGSSAVVFQQRSGGTQRIEWTSVAGELAESPDGRADWEDAIKTVLELQQPGIFLRLKAADSASEEKPQTCECLVVPWHSNVGTVGAMVLLSPCAKRCLNPTDLQLLQSLTCFVRLGAEKKEAELRAAMGFASAARLANEVAHEINNPLQALMNSLHLISVEHPSDVHLKQAREEVRRLAGVVRSMLELGARKNPWA